MTTEPPSKKLNMFKDTTPGSTKTLRKKARESWLNVDVDAFQKELAGESDRASVVLLGTMLEDVLTYRLTLALCIKPTEDECDYIFRFDGPMGTFSRRAEIACLLGIIEDDTYEQLDIIREMRNACAHSRHPLTFADEALANVAMRLFKPLGFVRKPDRKEIKQAVLLEGFFIYYTLILGSRAKGEARIRSDLESILDAQPPSQDKPHEQ